MPTYKINVSDNNHCSRQIKENTFADLFLPSQALLRLVGVNNQLVNCYRNNIQACKYVSHTFHLLYFCAVFTLLVLNVVRLMYDMFTENDNIHSGLMTTSANLVLSIGFVYCYAGSCWAVSGNFERFIEGLHRYQVTYGISFNPKKLKKIYCLISVFGLISAIGASVAYALLLAYANERSVMARANLSSTILGDVKGTLKILMAAWSGICVFYWTILYMSMGGLYVLGIFVIYRGFKTIPKELSTAVFPTKECFKRIRQKFEALVSLTRRLDKLVYHFSAMNSFVSMTVICLMMYGFFHGYGVTEDYFLSSFILIDLFNFLVLSIVAGISLTDKIHEPLDILHQLDLTDMSEKAAYEVSMFVSRLSSGPIGLTVLGLFVIDRSSVLMFSGTILTYAIVMWQLSPQNSGATSTEDLLQLILAKLNNTELELQKLLNSTYQ